MILNKADFVNSTLRTKDVEISALNGSTRVRELTSAQVIEFSQRQAKNPVTAVYYLIQTGVIDENGQPVFGEDDIEQLKSLGGTITNPLVQAVMSISGMAGVEDAAEKKRELKEDHRRRLMFRLCLSVGCPHPDHLSSILSDRQINDWILFTEIEPWGSPADDCRTAILTWAAIQPHSKKRLEVGKFLPQWGPKEPMTAAQYKQKAMAMYGRF